VVVLVVMRGSCPFQLSFSIILPLLPLLLEAPIHYYWTHHAFYRVQSSVNEARLKLMDSTVDEVTNPSHALRSNFKLTITNDTVFKL
jgi:hypothetical protein